MLSMGASFMKLVSLTLTELVEVEGLDLEGRTLRWSPSSMIINTSPTFKPILLTQDFGRVTMRLEPPSL
jgi:hypothetical protein